MSTLYKRATKNQMRLLKAVSGAVLNEADAHGRVRDERQARSIAKRAVGTISAMWPDLLVAAQSSPSNGIAVGLKAAIPHLGHTGSCPECARRSQMSRHRAKRRWGQKSTPLLKLIKQLSYPLGQMKKIDPDKAAVYIEILRKADKIVKGLH